MSLQPLVLFGAGGHALEVAQIVRDINAVAPRWVLLGTLVDTAFLPGAHGGDPMLSVLGDASWIDRHGDVQVLVAIGDPAVRQRVVRDLLARRAGLHFATLIHPRAWIAAGSEPGDGSVVFAGALVNVDTRIGAHAIVNLGCTISHGCRIGDFVSLGPGACLPGRVHVGDLADLGAGCIARPRARIGTGVVLGAGAVAVEDMPDGCIAVGVPARPVSA
jgi:sugar O-acyltransferase (sialic acid O-acetyltransferase NeuD family)